VKNWIAVILLSGYSAVCVAQHHISGTVNDISGGTLPGATVQLLDTEYGVIADDEGNFRLNNIPSGDYSLQVSFVGFETYVSGINVSSDKNYLKVILKESVLIGEEVFVYATRAHDKTPTTYSIISKQEISERNLGQDLPILLNYTPSIVTTSDAGAGVGYTGLRIRGSDATRINVTINGIP